MSERFDQALRAYIDEQGLNPQQLRKLQARLQDDTKSGAGTHRIRPRFLRDCAALAAGMLLTLVTMYLTLPSGGPNAAERIVREVSMNHRNPGPADFEGSSLAALDTRLATLQFRLKPSRRLATQTSQVTGARYCSLLGHQAAQVRLVDSETGRMHTVYQTSMGPDFASLPDVTAGEEPDVYHRDGLRVEVWVEDDRVHALVAP